MAFTADEKRATIARCLASRDKAFKLELELLFASNGQETAEIREARKRARELTAEIEQLQVQLMTEWLGNASDLEDKIRLANNAVQASINKVRKNVRTAQTVVSALGRLDEVIGIAKSLVAPG